MDRTFEEWAIILAPAYNKSREQTEKAMQKYASQKPCSWRDINWGGIDLAPYYESEGDRP